MVVVSWAGRESPPLAPVQVPKNTHPPGIQLKEQTSLFPFSVFFLGCYLNVNDIYWKYKELNSADWFKKKQTLILFLLALKTKLVTSNHKDSKKKKKKNTFCFHCFARTRNI